MEKTELTQYVKAKFVVEEVWAERLCGLMVTLSGYTPRGTGFDSGRDQIF
jgi:hypothetical protein